jgi:hypothetical protein
MKINKSDIKVPLKKTVEVKNNVAEVSLSKRTEEASEAFKQFVFNYVNSSETATIEEASALFVQYEDVILEKSDSAELTPAQKKLPPVIQKAILEKMKKKQAKAQEMEEEEEEMKEDEEMEEEDDEEEMEEEKAKASGQKTTFLNRNDIVQSKPGEIQVKK